MTEVVDKGMCSVFAMLKCQGSYNIVDYCKIITRELGYNLGVGEKLCKAHPHILLVGVIYVLAKLVDLVN